MKEGMTRVLVITVIVLFMILLSGGATAWFVISRAAPKTPQPLTPEAVGTGAKFNLGEFVTNMADEEAKRYISVSIQLEYNPKNKKLGKELTERAMQLQDKAYFVLRGKKLADVSGQNGMEALRQELKKTFNGLLQNGQIDSVYFTKFVIQ